jgi:transketolase
VNPEILAILKRDALSVRRKFLEMHFRAQAGHIGTGLSSIEILTYLYRCYLQPSDRFILSKGHGASALYATLNHMGLLGDADLATYYQDGTLLPAHPAATAWEAIPAATGALGHGSPIATGIAYTFKHLHGSSKRVVALLSDGECNEGSTWEAALFASHHRLNNLTFVIDLNGLQGFGRTEEVLDMRPFAQKWSSFGFETLEIDGHDFGELDRAIMAPRDERPRCVVASTIKGKGVSFMENKLEWHYLPLKEDLFKQALADLESGLGARR